ncbi:hypothetical protein [Alistipes indistinctus]|uniref:hypothetical protein n=1 Tax=Alistipes indistinctus TaxID=626932 RepID=UPI003AB68719
MALRPNDDREKSEQEYRIIHDAFVRLLDEWDNGAGRLDAVTDIITHRAAFLIERVISGMSLDFEQALALLKRHNDFTTAAERQKRDILIAAIDNLVDFAAAQQYSMMRELPEELDGSYFDEYENICRRYNLTWAAQENEDVLYAALMAAWWLTVSSDTMLTYMTQGDERVRPWHEALEGISYPKSQFPAELIPPIEYACRCYLVAEGFGDVVGALPKVKTVPAVHPVFRESLCTGGRIFSGEHPYFRETLPPELQNIVKTIKRKFYL